MITEKQFTTPKFERYWFKDIKSEADFLEAWRLLRNEIVAEVRVGGKPIKHKNWKKLDRMKEELCYIWHENFYYTIAATVVNNLDPRNFPQFCSFELMETK